MTKRRREVIEAGHAGDAETARAGLRDPDPSVRASALRALERTDDLTKADLEASFADPEVLVRRTAAEMAARLPGADLLALLRDEDDTVVEVAAWAFGEWGTDAGHAVPLLTDVCQSHRDSLCREAAVAALGAIGTTDGLEAILAALADKATVRRRAVIALAAFDGPDVEAALRSSLDDRDWQVRQVAEDLLEDRDITG